MVKYLRYTVMHVALVLTIIAIALGGLWIWVAGAILGGFLFIGDHIFGSYTKSPEYKHPVILNAFLYIVLPLLAMASFTQAWMVGSGDLLGFGAAVQAVTGFDLFQARETVTPLTILGYVIVLGVLVAAAGTNVGHELTHRTWSPSAMLTGRWLLAFSANPDFAIEHVYNHHAHVGTTADPATARRNQTNVWLFFPQATIREHKAAWKMELERLRKMNQSVLSYHNSMLRGYAMVLALALVFWASAGWTGVGVFLATAIVGKFTLEVTNFMEHFGLVRVPEEPVQPRHSWNTNRRVSSLVLYSLTRHSAHHEQGDIPFWELAPYPDAPDMPHGYAGTFLAALCPPLWRRIITPRLLEWDEVQASPAERELAARENAASRIPALREAAQSRGATPA